MQKNIKNYNNKYFFMIITILLSLTVGILKYNN
jgi:hypothetical protein